MQVNRIINRSAINLISSHLPILNGGIQVLSRNPNNFSTCRSYSDNVSAKIHPVQTKDTGFFNKILKKMGVSDTSKPKIKMNSFILYECVADKINYIEFFETFKLPNTFNSWFIVTELHVWMLLLRSMAEGSETGEDGRFLRNSIVEAMWLDVNARAKKLGASNPSGTRAQIEILSEQFQAALIAYDEGILSDDIILASALWRRFFEQNCDDYTIIERLVKYVRIQVQMLDSLNKNIFMIKPKIEWIPLKDIQIISC